MDPFEDDSDAISTDLQEGDTIILNGCGERSHPENHWTKVKIEPRDPPTAVTEVTVFADDRSSEVTSGSSNHQGMSPFVSVDQYSRPQSAAKTVKQLAQAYLAVQQMKEEANNVSPRLPRSSGRLGFISLSTNPFLTDSEDQTPAEVSTGETHVQESVSTKLPTLNVETSDGVTPAAPLPPTNPGSGADLMEGNTNPPGLPKLITPTTANVIEESTPVENTSSTARETTNEKNPVQYQIDPESDEINPVQKSAIPDIDAIKHVQSPIETSQDSNNSTQYQINTAESPEPPVHHPMNSVHYPANSQNAIKNLDQDPISSSDDPISPAQDPTNPVQNLIHSTQFQNPTQFSVSSTLIPIGHPQSSTDATEEPPVPALKPSGKETSQINTSRCLSDVTLISQDPLISANSARGDAIPSLQDVGLARIHILNAAVQELPPIQETLTTQILPSESSFHFPDPPRPAPLVCVPVKEVKFEEPVKHEIVTSQTSAMELGEIVPISVKPSNPVQSINEVNEVLVTCTTTQSTLQTKDSLSHTNPNISEAELNHQEQEVYELEAPGQNQDGFDEHNYDIGNEDNMSEITLSPVGEHNNRDPENCPNNNGSLPHRIRISIDHQAATPSRKMMAITVLLILLLPSTVLLLAAYKVLHKSPPD